jgi:hypothetical protein
MKTIWYEDITDVLLSIADPNTWWAISSVPWVSSPKINWATSVYNVEAEWWSGIAWWSTNVNWYASDYNTVARWSGSIYLPDWTNITISSGNTGNMSAVTYIYYDRDLWSVQTTTSAQTSVWENKILLCVASPTSSGKDAEFQAFGTNKQSTFITADNIAANTITGNEIAANTITASEIESWAITTAKIDAWAVTASKITVTALSDIDSDLWTITAGTIKWTTIIAWSETWAAIKLYPYSSTTGRLEYYYGGNSVGYIAGWSVNGWWAIAVNASIFWMASGTMVAWGKLRIPVWTNLYD